MPPRLNKRQQREQEELRSLAPKADPSPAAHDDDEPEDVPLPVSKVIGGFAALMTGEDDDEDEEEDTPTAKKSAKKKSKKKKKKDPGVQAAAGVAIDVPSIETPAAGFMSDAPTPSSGPSKKDKKAAKKARRKGENAIDELDRALSELSVKYPDLPTSTTSTASTSFAHLLSITPQNLDADAELRRFFGSKVVASNSAEGSRAQGRRLPAGKHLQKSVLTKPKSTWWPAAAREGLSIRALTREEVEEVGTRRGIDGIGAPSEKWWTVEYSRKYRGVTMGFMQSVASGDPENFWRILSKLPYHADTLLQLAEAYRYREEHAQAMDFTDRALFTYERAFVGAFSLTNGTNRLDFDRVENRPFFLAVHRQVSDLQRRGCFRTAFEFGKLLLALDPAGDPHGAWLHLDHLAIKSGNRAWLEEVWQAAGKGEQAGLSPGVLPGWAYSRALGLWMDEEEKGNSHEASKKALREAIIAWPSVVPLLADKADISLSGETRAHKAFRIHTDATYLSTESDTILHLLSHLYAQRSGTLWKPPELGNWFATAVSAALSDLPANPSTPNERFHTLFSPRTLVAGAVASMLFAPAQLPATLAYSVYRHVVVNEGAHRSLLAFLPRAALDATRFAGDPVPPPRAVSTYDAEFFKGAEDVFVPTRREAGRALEQVIPDAGQREQFRRQVQGMFDGNPRLQQQFPGGVDQFAILLAQMPDEAVEDFMAQAAGAFGDEPAPPAMPGEMPGEVELEWVEQGEVNERLEGGAVDPREDDEDENDDGAASMPVLLFRGLFNRVWGRNGADDSEDGEDEEEGQDRFAGVD